MNRDENLNLLIEDLHDLACWITRGGGDLNSSRSEGFSRAIDKAINVIKKTRKEDQLEEILPSSLDERFEGIRKHVREIERSLLKYCNERALLVKMSKTCVSTEEELQEVMSRLLRE